MNSQKVAYEIKVVFSLHTGCWLCDDQNRYNTFSGFLLYATEWSSHSQTL